MLSDPGGHLCLVLGIDALPGLLALVDDGAAKQLKAKPRIVDLAPEKAVGLLRAALGDAGKRKGCQLGSVRHTGIPPPEPLVLLCCFRYHITYDCFVKITYALLREV